MNRTKDKTVDELLARVRKTIADSRELVACAELRIAETDRLLAAEGLTREEVMNYSFTPEQRRAVNEELVRRGLKPIEDEAPPAAAEEMPGAEIQDGAREDLDLAARSRKFGMMMRDVRL